MERKRYTQDQIIAIPRTTRQVARSDLVRQHGTRG